MKKIFCALIVNTAPSTDIDGTKHRLVKSVKVYCADYDTNEWSLDYTQNVEYQNAYPTMIEQVYSDEEIGSSKILFEYTFENNLPKTSVIKNDADHETTKIEYNNGRVYNVHTDNEGAADQATPSISMLTATDILLLFWVQGTRRALSILLKNLPRRWIRFRLSQRTA